MEESGGAPEAFGQCQLLIEDDSKNLAKWKDDATDSFKRKCKIICTMGPSCWSVENLCKMIDAGMNIARLNFSHGDHAGHGATVERIREAMKLRPGKNVGILLDTKGPEIRTGFFREGDKIELTQGQDLKIVTDYSFKGDNTCIAVSYDKLCTSVKPGGMILCADGSLSLKVKEVGSDFVMTEVQNSIKLGERKNCNLPGVAVDLPVLQEKDIKDLLEFGIPQGVDFVAASFVQSAADVKFIRSTLGTKGRHIKIISKIENQEGLINFNEICKETDGVMVARGDLGMEIPPEKVFLAQKMMISKCNLWGKPVITATQMLESMTGSPRPTRAEASDVANSVLDGTDCVMLSGETAGGSFPLEAVTVMRRICEEAEERIDYPGLYLSLRLATLHNFGTVEGTEAMASGAVKTAMELSAAVIIALTETGTSARMIAKYKPACPILAFSQSEVTVRQLLCVRGIIPVLTDSFEGTDSVIKKAIAKAKDDGIVKTGDLAICIHGQQEDTTELSSPKHVPGRHKRMSMIGTSDMQTLSTGASNLLKIVDVP